MGEKGSDKVDKFLSKYKKEFFSDVKGKVLEIGPGYGTTMQYLNFSKIDKYVLLEPNEKFHGKLEATASKLGINVDRARGNKESKNTESDIKSKNSVIIVEEFMTGADSIPPVLSENGPYDCVISSLVLCSVDDVESAVKGIVKVLKPGGKFYFIEHIYASSPDTTWNLFIRLAQKALTPIWTLVSGNCHLNRDTIDIIKRNSGLSSVTIVNSNIEIDNLMGILAPMSFGYATRK
ncbi:Methyltransferase-like protein 7A [Smittium culicis]|uniref:Methyltransferase-like protein 7A n=1 Tax=Smittium culicis TaxID=133412 RepID=A0A1R1YSY3_9FUNG|nr:Methyltransferase-like protein 7A [Smittium culicis]